MSRWWVGAVQGVLECVEERVGTLVAEGACEVVKIQSPDHPAAITLVLHPGHLRKDGDTIRWVGDEHNTNIYCVKKI